MSEGVLDAWFDREGRLKDEVGLVVEGMEEWGEEELVARAEAEVCVCVRIRV